jgi:hypothetical protein
VQSGEEESTLAQIQAAHDGSSDDEKGLISFRTNDGNDSNSPTERWRITSDGHFKAMVNGYGIDFSATEGSNASASILDDYEEGSWTPSNPTVTLTGSPSGRYIKVGAAVHLHATFTVPVTSSSNTLVIDGIPFAQANISAAAGFYIRYTTDSSVRMFYLSNGSRIDSYNYGGAATTLTQVSNKRFDLSGVYYTDS